MVYGVLNMVYGTVLRRCFVHLIACYYGILVAVAEDDDFLRWLVALGR